MGDTSSMTASQSSSMMNASMATSAISSIAGTIGQVNAIKAQGDYQASIANTNSALAKLKARQTLEAGDISASRKNLQTKGAVGAFRAQAGGSGVDVNKGSPAMVQSDIRTSGAMDELTIKNNAARAAWGYETQAIEDTFAGKFSALTAKSQATQSIVTGGLQAVSGPMAMYSQSALWQYRYGLKGVPGIPFPGASMGGGGTNSQAIPSSNSDDFWGTPD